MEQAQRLHLSFNWRLVMAPDFVPRYIVTHEVVHLAIPDHSQRFWLTVQSLCPSAERARQWLVANADLLLAADCIAAVAQEEIGIHCRPTDATPNGAPP